MKMDSSFPPEMVPDIEKFFRDVHPTLRPGQTLYEEVFKTALFFPLQRQRELHRMMSMAAEIEPRTVMEIGADKGGGLYHWCMLPTVKNVIACEVRGTPYDSLFTKEFPHLNFHWMPCSSYDGPGRRSVGYFLQSRFVNRPEIDILFIDGDKRAFEKDFDLYWPLISPGGLVFLHDIRDTPGPRDAWENILKRLPLGTWWDVVIDVEDANEAVAREVAGIPSSCPHEDWLRHWRGRSCGFGVICKENRR